MEALGDRAQDVIVLDDEIRKLEDLDFHPIADDWNERMVATDSVFKQKSVEDIISALKKYEGKHKQFCEEALDAFKKNSPLSMKLVFEQLNRSRDMELGDCLEMEFKLAQRCALGEGDFWEGVRAVLIDKDQKPNWKYKNVEEVPDGVIKRFFEDREDLGSLNLRTESKM